MLPHLRLSWRPYAARDSLAKDFAGALKAILADDILRAARGPAAPAEPHPLDVQLLGRLRRQIPERLQLFLHSQNFGTPFNRHILDPIHEMKATWVGANFEFHDPVIRGLFAEVRQKAVSLGELTSTRLFLMGDSVTMVWPKTDYDLAHGIQQSSLEAIEAIRQVDVVVATLIRR